MPQSQITGTWDFYGKPEQDGQQGRGQIRLTLTQFGDDITGHLVQVIDPWTQEPPADPEQTRATVIGRLYVGQAPQATLVEIVRFNEHNDFRAIFVGVLSANGQEVSGHIVNSRGNGGSFVMRKDVT